VKTVCLSLLCIAVASAAGAQTSATRPTSAIVVLGPAPQTRPTTATPIPRFDRLAKQPNLECFLPAIRAWNVVRHVKAKTLAPETSGGRFSLPQIILSQRPPGRRGLSKYSVIYEPTAFDPRRRETWRAIALSFYNGFVASLRKGERFEAIEVSSPTVAIEPGGERRIYLSYGVKMRTGERARGAILGIPARGGVLFFNLTLEGQGPDAVETAMGDLRLALEHCLKAKPRRSLKPYLIGFLLVLPIVVLVIALVLRRGRLGGGRV